MSEWGADRRGNMEALWVRGRGLKWCLSLYWCRTVWKEKVGRPPTSWWIPCGPGLTEGSRSAAVASLHSTQSAKLHQPLLSAETCGIQSHTYLLCHHSLQVYRYLFHLAYFVQPMTIDRGMPSTTFFHELFKVCLMIRYFQILISFF